MLERPFEPSQRNSLLIMAAVFLFVHLTIWSTIDFGPSSDKEGIADTSLTEQAGVVNTETTVEVLARADSNLITREVAGEHESTTAGEPSGTNDTDSSTARLQDSESTGQYRVESGDTLYWIARAFDTTVQELQRLNRLSGSTIRVGQLLEVPTETVQNYPAGVSLTSGEVRWLAQMIHAESRGEPYLGQVAVGSVILNRIKSSQFPSTMQGVLFQARAFQPIANGSFYRPANDMAYRAALEALNGHDPSKGSLFFFNPRQSSDRFMHARPAMVTIGQHRFMR